jgi:copper homeostasis protein
MALVEACVESLDEARAAEAGGAARLELCVDLAHDGRSPTAALLDDCLRIVRIPVFVMVRRTREGFVYPSDEIAAMAQETLDARRAGAHGIVTGALTVDGRVDITAMTTLLDAAGDTPVTFHRAFDTLTDPDTALEELVRLGVARILTSGCAPSAAAGAATIARLQRLAAGRIGIVAAGGVRAHNVAALLSATGVDEVHAHLSGADEVARLVLAARPG